MKRRKVWLLAMLALSLLITAAPVYAGSINGPEAGLISQASGTFTYEGKSYVATPGALAQLKAYLSRDDIDLTQEQADRAASLMYSNVEGGVLDGYLTPVGGSSGIIDGNSDSNSILNSPKGKNKQKGKKEKAGQATVKVTERDSLLKVTGKDGKELFTAQLPVKDTGSDLSGLLTVGITLFTLIPLGVFTAWKLNLFAHDHES
ncbi:hypothetical protein LI177_01875 [bacterium 210820-DFI.6.37]|nr:hypothetical protein [bacterium 210820-DFI.6.37]